MNERHVQKKLSARETALNCLLALKKGVVIQETLARNLEASQLGMPDKKLVSDLAYGYLRNVVRINFILEYLLEKPGNLPKALRLLLGLGVYTMLFQDKIPDYAAVDETVKISRKMFGQKMARLANAVLRNFQRLGDAPAKLQWYEDNMPAWEAAGVFYGIPSAIASLWKKAYGRNHALALMRRSAARPWTGIRFNASKSEARELCASLRPIPGQESLGQWAWAFAPGKLPEKIGGKDLNTLEKEGLIFFQSPASILVSEKLGLNTWGKPVWDCCAGSGIKLTGLMENGVPVRLASDISSRRLANIRPFCLRQGLSAPLIARASAAQPPLVKWHGDIIADVPCSGLGTLARRPDLRYGFLTGIPLLENIQLQSHILAALVPLMPAGGRLAYITCALNPDENENQIRKTLERFPGLSLIKEWQTPHEHTWLEGMYGAVLEKI